MPRRTSDPGFAALQWVLPLFDEPTVSARQRISLSGRELHYELRRSARRSIGFLIDDSGLRITAPRHTPLAEIEAALVEKSGWVLRKLSEWEAHRARRERLRVRWESGGQVHVLGEPLTLLTETGPSRSKIDRIRQEGTTLRVLLPKTPSDPSGWIREQVHTWLKLRARECFGERLPPLTERLGRAPRAWTLSSARTRWGSCTHDGCIRLNWRLIHYPLPVIDYVIAHELAHLVHMNHGPRFWAKVRALVGDFEDTRRFLNEYPDDLTLS